MSRFVDRAAELSRMKSEPCECVAALAPLMQELIDAAAGLLESEHNPN
ncbi:hypothetical protein ID144_17725 [Pseudomonas sp. JM0905a]|nr:hypothetical protein [Pseudomonas sp. JM0905a]MBD2838885.1 hypothetical protein [Pseudomonas sp. JM0905a]